MIQGSLVAHTETAAMVMEGTTTKRRATEAVATDEPVAVTVGIIMAVAVVVEDEVEVAEEAAMHIDL